MGISLDNRRLGGLAVGAVAAFALIGGAGTGASQMGDSGVSLDAARSATHLLGLGSSLLLAHYAVQARRRFAGGVFGESATATAVGAGAFALAFLVMELNHGLGVDLLAGLGGMQLGMAVSMFLFTGTAFAFGWAFAEIADALGGSGP